MPQPALTGNPAVLSAPRIMLIIRPPQMAAIAEQLLLGRLTVHLRQYFPEQCSAFGQDGLRDHVLTVLEQIRPFELCEETLYKYMNITIIHGINFQERPEHAWMATYLHDASVPDYNDRIRRLYSAVVARAERERSNRKAREMFNGQ